MLRWMPVLERLLDAFFPPRCAGCGRLGSWFCPRCQAATPRASPLSLLGLDDFSAGAVLEGPLQRALHEYKYRPRPMLAGPLAGVLAHALTGKPVPDAVVPVPLHRRRRQNRGFDQAEVLARAVARELGVGWLPGLERVRDTPPQVGLPADERERNVRGAFAWCSDAPAPPRVLLVDDVATTGSTLRASAAGVRAAGGRVVSAAVVARARELV